ncbi:hypothetical protein Tco_0406988 [Tanacetum coccineum]
MIDCLSIVETDKVIHIVEIDIVKLVVEIESFGMSADEFDKETGSSDGLQPKQVDLVVAVDLWWQQWGGRGVWRLVVFSSYCDDSGGVDVVVRVAWGDEGGGEAMGYGVEGGDEVVWRWCGSDVVVGITMVM